MLNANRMRAAFSGFSAALLLTTLAGCATSSSQNSDAEEVARGREQMIRAFDAAWVRVVASGEAAAVLETEPPNQPGLAATYVVRIVDCLPLPELTPFPDNPTGLLKQVLETGEIRRLVQNVPNTPADTSYYFSGVAAKYLPLVIGEIEKHYGASIKVIDVGKPPGPLASTSALLDDEVDFISQLNATGGRTQDMRRRTSRRFSCTMSSLMQFIHVPEESEFADQINSFADLKANPDIRICAGPLSTQTAKAFLPKHTVITRYTSDIVECDQLIETGKADLIIGPLPSLDIAGMPGYKPVHTMIVAGTPFWVALENVECDAPTGPRDEGKCNEIDPL
jgi:ABC-type amino acid transport substrate-binding protein